MSKLVRWWETKPGDVFQMRLSEYCALSDRQKALIKGREIVGGMIEVERLPHAREVAP